MFASQFVAQALALLPHSPPEPKRGPRFAPAGLCWLCGAETNGEGWFRAGTFPPTFTNVNLASAPGSPSVCQACVAVSSGETWRLYAERHPALGLVTKHPISWRSYGHLVTAEGASHPKGREWRRWLLEPPVPPFVCVIPTSNQKHLLFRAAIATDREWYPVQLEEERVWVAREAFTACLTAFEVLYRLGLSKEGIATGRYHQGSLGKVVPRAFRAAESDFAPWRWRAPDLVRLAAICATREEKI